VLSWSTVAMTIQGLWAEWGMATVMNQVFLILCGVLLYNTFFQARKFIARHTEKQIDEHLSGAIATIVSM
jgi:hypothetical protein